MNDEFSTYDAAYLIGALSAQDRQAYERHLAECANCSQAVSRLAGIPGLLARLSPDEARAVAGADEEEVQVDHTVPPTLLPKLLSEVSVHRTRARWTTGLVAAAAAVALLVAVLVGVVTRSTHESQPTPIALHSVAASVPVQATAQLQDRAWGTHIRLRCTYDGSRYSPGTYSLVVKTRSGKTQKIATWSVIPGVVSTVDASTALHRDAIASIQIRSNHNKPLMALSL